MKLCWDNIENIRLTKNSNFRDIVKEKTYYLKVCKKCEEEYFGYNNSMSCSASCSSRRKHTKEAKKKMSEIKKGKKASDETKLKMSKSRRGEKNGFFGKIHSKETRKKLSKKLSNENSTNWKGGVTKKNIPLYDTYAPQLEWTEKIRRNKEDQNVLEVKCFKCGKWYIPKRSNVKHRINSLNGKEGHHRFYCSDNCKNSCSIFHKSADILMKEDAIRAGRLKWLELNREVQPELRKMVLERDKYQCVKCGSIDNLHCHHILPVSIEPLLSTDIDNCMTLCIDCHKEAHQKDGCRYEQLKMELCIK